MQCVNHSEVIAVARCTGCAELFCHNCLVEVAGQKYCAACKGMAVTKRPVVDRKMTLCAEAKTALIMACVGGFIFSFILGPLSVFIGAKAWKKIKSDPNLTGSGLAVAAMVVGVLVSVMGVIGLIVAAQPRHH